MGNRKISYPHYIVRRWFRSPCGTLTSRDDPAFDDLGCAIARAKYINSCAYRCHKVEVLHMDPVDGGTVVRVFHRGDTEPEDDGLAEDVRIKYGYKIHGFKTANGETASACTQKFYETYDAAFNAASRCVRQSNFSDDGIVIYKAIKLVRPVRPAVRVETIDIKED